jgi:hypothetical protein
LKPDRFGQPQSIVGLQLEKGKATVGPSDIGCKYFFHMAISVGKKQKWRLK